MRQPPPSDAEIIDAVKQCNGDREIAAVQLGIPVGTVYYRLRKLHPSVAPPPKRFKGSQLPTPPIESHSGMPLLDMVSANDLTRLFAQDPIWPPPISRIMNRFVLEQQKSAELQEAGLSPSRSMIFTGRPGVGKTFAAKWLAAKLDRTLATVNLAAIVSNHFGQTGRNVELIFEHAEKFPCVLFLDEFDAIAIARGTDTAATEVNRMVNVLLQQLDKFVAGESIVIAATNLPDMIDKAVWRRFEFTIEFPVPSGSAVNDAVRRFIGDNVDGLDSAAIERLATVFDGKSFAAIERDLLIARRTAIVEERRLVDVLIELIWHREAA